MLFIFFEFFLEEAYIADLDAKSGASLKLTILNKSGRIWTMVAGGGASVIYSDTICDLGGTNELANYGEYSGAPSEQQTLVRLVGYLFFDAFINSIVRFSFSFVTRSH